MYEKDFPIYSLDFVKKNKHWISAYGGYNGLSPYYAEDTNTGLTIPNCVPFVYGYWHCMGDCKEPKELKLSPYNANSFWTYPDGYARSSTVPKIGAIACWSGGYDGYGHTAIVTGIYNNGDGITTLNSAYKSTMYYTRSLKRPFNFGAYKFQGFIYCPFVEPDPEPVPPEPTYKFAIGDKVELTGDLYRSSNSEEPAGYIRDRVTEITRLAKGTKHPYNTTGDLGWCDEDALKAYTQPTFKVGDRVEPIKNVSYTGSKVVRWDDYYYITELRDDRAVLSAKRGNKMVVWCAMNTNNIRKA